MATGTLYRYSVKEARARVMTADSSASTTGPTYASTYVKIPGVISIGISGNATQEQLEGDDVVIAVESTDEALDITIEHAQESFDLMEVLKGWSHYADGDNAVLVDIPAETTRYCELEFRCHKTGDAGGDLVVLLPKFNAANVERNIENKAFGTNSFTGQAIYTTSTIDVDGSAKNFRMKMTQRPTAVVFTYGAADSTAPTVSCVPTDGATGVSVSANIVWTASEALDPNQVNTANVLVFTATGTPVTGTVALVNNGSSTTITFNPTGDLSASTAYIAMLTTNIRDSAGNKLAAPSLINFTTA